MQVQTQLWTIDKSYNEEDFFEQFKSDYPDYSMIKNSINILLVRKLEK